MDREGKKKHKKEIPEYLRKPWLKALLLGQRRWCQTCMLGVEQMTCIHIKCWDLSCSTSGRAIQLVPDSKYLPATERFSSRVRGAATVSISQYDSYQRDWEKKQNSRAECLASFGIFSNSPPKSISLAYASSVPCNSWGTNNRFWPKQAFQWRKGKNMLYCHVI